MDEATHGQDTKAIRFEDTSAHQWKVFVSSTSFGLLGFRDVARDVITKFEYAGVTCFEPDMMEDFGAQDGPAREVCARKVKDCDVLVGIIGIRYGAHPPDDQTSYTELEFQTAVDENRSRLMFLLDETVARQLEGAQQMASRTETAIALLDKQRLSRKQALTKDINSQKAILATLTAQEQATVTGGSIGAGGTISATYTGPTSSQADKAVEYAYSKLGDPYVYGATGPSSFDCSGLVQAAWASAGVDIPRTTYEQAAAGYPAIPKSELEPGDLVFFNGDSHVGMYVGGGDMIDAPQTGEDVEKVSLSGSWYVDNYDGAVRP